MSLRVRFQYQTGANLVYSIERLGDGTFYDFGAGTFGSSPGTGTAALREGTGTGTSYLGRYTVTLATTSAGQWTDGAYSVSVHNLGSGLVVGELAVVMHTQDDQPTFPAGSSDPWSTSLGTYTAGMAGYILNHLSLGADPLTNIVPGAYTAGMAGYILGHNLDALISSRLASAGYTAPDNADIATIATSVGAGLGTNLAAVKAQTDLLHFTGTALQSTLVATALNALLPEPVHAPTLTVLQIFAALGSMVMATRSGATGLNPSTVQFHAVGDPSTTRVTLVTDGKGNVTAVTLNLP